MSYAYAFTLDPGLHFQLNAYHLNVFKKNTIIASQTNKDQP